MPSPLPATTSAPALAGQMPISALVVAGEPAAGWLLGALRAGGFMPAAARVATAEALEDALAGASWDVVIADWRLATLPGPDALALVRRAGARRPPEVPLVAFLANALTDVDGAATAMRAGARDIVGAGDLGRLAPAVAREVEVARRLRAEQERHQDRERRSMQAIVEAIVTTMEARDPYTGGHQRRVSTLAAAIAREAGLEEDRVHGLALAGLVHDIGKIHVPQEILARPGRLSAIEYAFVKLHCQVGHDILKGIDFPWPIAEMVYQHHERLDGQGYPRGLAGEAILPEARILAVADVVEAMLSHRPYRPAHEPAVALAELRAGRDTAFDGAAVDACLALFGRGYVLA